MRTRTGTALTTALAVTALLLTGTSSAAAPGAKLAGQRFNGVWQLVGAPIIELKTAQGKAPPLRPEARDLYAVRKQALAAGDKSFDPGEQCKPLGNPRLLWELGWPFDIQITDERVLFGYTWNRLHRIVYVAAGEPEVAGPTYLGTSHAEIKGNTLTVRSAGYHDTTLLDASGLPHSDAMTLTENYDLSADGNALTLRLRIVDDRNYTRAWNARVQFRRVPDGRIREDVCELRLGLYQPG